MLRHTWRFFWRFFWQFSSKAFLEIAKSAWLNSWRVTISIAGAGTLGNRWRLLANFIAGRGDQNHWRNSLSQKQAHLAIFADRRDKRIKSPSVLGALCTCTTYQFCSLNKYRICSDMISNFMARDEVGDTCSQKWWKIPVFNKCNNTYPDKLNKPTQCSKNDGPGMRTANRTQVTLWNGKWITVDTEKMVDLLLINFANHFQEETTKHGFMAYLIMLVNFAPH